MTAAVVFFFGLCLGSFLNVCIHRLPRGESVVAPRSRCPQCGQPIAAYDNIPVISYLLLGGRCRHCRTPISLVYPAVELLTAGALVLVYLTFGFTPQALKAALLAGALIVLIVTDLRERLLPDRITLPGMAAGLLFALWLPLEDGTSVTLLRAAGVAELPARVLSLGDALLAALVGGGLLFVLGELWYRLRGVEAMGLGDVKMMAMVGLFFGVKLTVVTLLLGSLAGSLAGVLFILLARKDTQYELPLGTFLGAAALVALLWGRWLVEAYVSLFA